jgi:putative transposase
VQGSNNRGKAKVRVARLQQKVRRQRQDFLHKLTTRIICTSGAVCSEDLNTKGLARTKLAKSVLDVGWGGPRRQLAYKGSWYGVPVVVIDRWYPSSKRCHACGHTHAGLTLAERTWTCPVCGCILDRDLKRSPEHQG